jgi:hypothetical protein
MRPIAFACRYARNAARSRLYNRLNNSSSQQPFSVNELVLIAFPFNNAVGYSGKGIDS